MQLIFEVLSGKANSVDPDQTAPEGTVQEQSDLGLHCIFHFIGNFGEQNFSTFTIIIRNALLRCF